MKKNWPIIILSFVLAAIPLVFTWLHSLFIEGLNPFLGWIFLILILIVVIPFYKWLSKTLNTHISITPAILFATSYFSFIISIFILNLFSGNTTLDIHLHDTYFVISNSYWIITIVPAVFAAIYYWFPQIFRRQMNAVLGYVHFWVTLLGMHLLFLPMQYEGMAGMPRRYYDYSTWQKYNDSFKFNELNRT